MDQIGCCCGRGPDRRRTVAAGFRDVEVENVALESSSESAEHMAIGLVRGNPVSLAINERGAVTTGEVERRAAEALRSELGDRPMRVSLHAFEKRTGATPANAIELARKRLADLLRRRAQ